VLRLTILFGSLALVLAAPATAAALPFGEVPFLPLASPAPCLRATGAPGELAHALETGVQLLQASATGIAPAAEVAVGDLPLGCPAVAAQPGGAGAMIAPALGPSPTHLDAEVWVAARDPGAGWTPAVRAAPVRSGAVALGVVAGVSARGDAIAAWVELSDPSSLSSPSEPGFRVRAVRRDPGGRFGPPIEIAGGKLTNPLAVPACRSAWRRAARRSSSGRTTRRCGRRWRRRTPRSGRRSGSGRCRSRRPSTPTCRRPR
jgi:hypothetical protein